MYTSVPSEGGREKKYIYAKFENDKCNLISGDGLVHFEDSLIRSDDTILFCLQVNALEPLKYCDNGYAKRVFNAAPKTVRNTHTVREGAQKKKTSLA